MARPYHSEPSHATDGNLPSVRARTTLRPRDTKAAGSRRPSGSCKQRQSRPADARRTGRAVRSLKELTHAPESWIVRLDLGTADVAYCFHALLMTDTMKPEHKEP